MPAHQDFEWKAAYWEFNGRSPDCLARGWELYLLLLWLESPGARTEGVSELLEEYYSASDLASPGWYWDVTDFKEYCGWCSSGLDYSAVNLQHCTGCHRPRCYQCSRTPYAPNGNSRCRCGAEMVG